MTDAPANADARFLACLAETLKWEGGYSDDPYDPGGPTNFGIIQTEYNAYRLRKGLPQQSVRNITPTEYGQIYRTKYWDEVNGDRLPPGVDLETFDFGVNAGPQRGIKCLQSALGVEADGHMGEITERALTTCDPLDVINKMADYRASYYRSLSTFWRFGKGWLSRVDGTKASALGMAASGEAVASAAVPHADAEAQSASQGKAYTPPPTSTAGTPTGQAAGVTGAAGNGAVGLSVAHAAQQSYTSGHGMDFGLFLITLASDPIFWVGVAVVSGACVAWAERSKLIKREAV